jgi:hypothetical protein
VYRGSYGYCGYHNCEGTHANICNEITKAGINYSYVNLAKTGNVLAHQVKIPEISVHTVLSSAIVLFHVDR